MKRLSKILSVFLCFVLVATMVPISTYATQSEDVISESASSVEEDNIEIEYEIESKRTEYSKTYKTSDGGFYQISTLTPIHELNDGVYEDINEFDNRIQTATDVKNMLNNEYEQNNQIDTRSDGTSGTTQSDECTMICFTSSTNTILTGECSVKGSRASSPKPTYLLVNTNVLSDKTVLVGSAKLHLNVDTSKTINNPLLDVYRLTSTWNSNITTKPSYDNNSILDYIDYRDYDSSISSISFDLTSYINYCSLGYYQNNGVIICPTDKYTDISFNNSVTLSIYYRELSDFDSRIQSEKVDMGRAGNVYINHFTATPTVVRDNIGVFDETAEVNIQSILNPLAVDTNSTDGVNSRTNYYSTIKYNDDYDEYLWKSCNGENIYFVYDSTGTSTKTYLGVDSNGDEYTLTLSMKNNDFKYRAYNKIVIEDAFANTYNFGVHNNPNTGLGYLVKISDNSNPKNIIRISYATVNSVVENNINKITTSNGRTYVYTYTGGLLTSIKARYSYEDEESGEELTDDSDIDSTPVEINFEYTDGYLTKVTYPDNYQVIYGYTNGKLTSITNNENGNSVRKNITFTYKENTNYLTGYVVKYGNTIIESKEINDATDSIYVREFIDTNNNSNSHPTKHVYYDNSGNLIRYSDYDKDNYYLNYNNCNLDRILLDSSPQNNYVYNGDFSIGYDGWTIDNEAIISSDNQLQLRPNGNEAYAYQTISNIPDNTEYVFCLDSTLEGNCLSQNETRKYYANVYYQDAALGQVELARIIFDDNYSSGNEPVQIRKMIFSVPQDVNEITVEIKFEGMECFALFDNVEIYELNNANSIDISNGSLPESFSYEFNNSGTIASITTSANDTSMGEVFDYDDNNYISNIDMNGSKTYYEYSKSNGLLLSKGKNKDSAKNTRYTYNGIGALIKVEQAISLSNGNVLNQSVQYQYSDDRVVSITHNGFSYYYDYNPNGTIKEIYTLKNDDSKDFSILYNYNANRLNEISYGNGDKLRYTYDGKNITAIYFNDDTTPSYEFTYDDNRLISYADNVNGTITEYTDNGYTITRGEDIIYSVDSDNETLFGTSMSVNQSVVELNNGSEKTTKTYQCSNRTYNIELTTDVLDRPTESVFKSPDFTVSNGITYIDTNTNGLTTNKISSYTSTIKKGSTAFPNIHLNTRLERKTTYIYDSKGRISEIYRESTNVIPDNDENTNNNGQTENVLIHLYEYDDSDQIISEADFDNNIVTKYSYNEGGNLTSKSIWKGSSYTYNSTTHEVSVTGSPTKKYTYSYNNDGNGDYLTVYNDSVDNNHDEDIEISYDASGNPLNYAGNGFTGEVQGTFEWQGNRLVAFYPTSSDEDVVHYEYKYDYAGYRTEKAVYSNNNLIGKYEYIWKDDIITAYCIQVLQDGVWYKGTVKPIYDSNNLLIGLSVISNSTSTPSGLPPVVNYAFIKDGQGNIVDMYSADETVVIHYDYDAFGNVTPKYSGELLYSISQQINDAPALAAILVGVLAGIAVAIHVAGELISGSQGYRGYMYDMETGLLATQSRYYSPSWGRFINIDDPMMLESSFGEARSANLFMYSNNDPINNTSPTGYDSGSYYENNILSLIGMHDTNLDNSSIAPATKLGTINEQLNILGLRLKANKDYDSLRYWDYIFDRNRQSIGDYYGIDYFNDRLSVKTSSNTKYSIKRYNSVYNQYQTVR